MSRSKNSLRLMYNQLPVKHTQHKNDEQIPVILLSIHLALCHLLPHAYVLRSRWLH
jgi:hypothetical protein